MRTDNSIKNIAIAMISQLIIIILGFVSRKVFIDSLGTDYLGINGLLTNVLSMLSLVEGGMGVSIVYHLYKPLAQDDIPQVISLVQFYKKVYGYLAIAVGILSILFYPFLPFFMDEQDIVPSLGWVYFIFVLKNIISYFNAHKWSLINANQKSYLIVRYNMIFTLFVTISKILVLVWTHHYVLYLIAELLVFVLQTIWNGKVVNKYYPYVNTKKRYELDSETRAHIFANVKSIFLHNIGTYCVFGTDNLLISSFVNIRTVGIYSNYTLILTHVTNLLKQVITGVEAGVGNLIATEGKDKIFEIYKKINFINFWIYSVAVICLYNVVEPFMNVWLGEGLLLSHAALILILVNFYLTGMRGPITTFKDKAGIFAPDRYLPLVEAGINLVSSIILAKYFGLLGIFLGTMISTLLIPFWSQPYIVYRYVLGQPFSHYFKTYFLFTTMTLSVGWMSTWMCHFIQGSGFIFVLLKGMTALIVCNIIYLIIFYQTQEFQCLLQMIIMRIEQIRNRDLMNEM